MARRERLTKEKIADALRKAGGLQMETARMLGCAVETVSRKLNRYPELRKVVDEAIEETLDTAESKLIEQIKAGNLTAIIFFLKTKGKHRGYTERIEQQDVREVTFRIVDETSHNKNGNRN